MMRHHVIISGTGRAGTTFLVILLTHLGLDTGFTPSNMSLFQSARAGLEIDIRDEKAPYIVKNPWLCDYIEEVLSSGKIALDYAFIPIRDLEAASQSRIYVENISDSSQYPQGIPGGLWHTTDPKDQERILSRQFYNLIFYLTRSEVPIMLMHYPRIIKDPAYLYRKLQFLVSDIPYGTFFEAFTRTVRPDLVHSFSDKDV